MIRAVVWNEYVHERENAVVREIYPDGIHAVIASGLQAADVEQHVAALAAAHGWPRSDLLDDAFVERRRNNGRGRRLVAHRR